MNILIPMAGNGQRFVDAGYTVPKPFIPVGDKPMIERVIDSLGGPFAGDYIFVVQAAHVPLCHVLRQIVPDCTFVIAHALTTGAACTALLARDLIATNRPLLIANSDQIVRYTPQYKWMRGFEQSNTFLRDGVIYTFTASHPKWSYVAVDPSDGSVWGVAEKQVISNRATCGIYWFRRGNDFVQAAEQMIAKNLRVNNEFYIAPVYNQMIAAELEIVERQVDEMWGLGTPEDLRAYNDIHFPHHRDS